MIIVTVSEAEKTAMCRGLRQSGIALLQVLLLSSIISMLAIRFTHTARDQIEMASYTNERVTSQLKAYSVVNQVVFVSLSNTMEMVAGNSVIPYQGDHAALNVYGEPIAWSEGVEVTLQDLNGLLPQQYPEHSMWRKILQRLKIPSKELDQYVGIWSDVQDPDLRSWMSGENEPRSLFTGKGYLNGYAQTDRVLTWIFHDRPSLIDKLQRISDVRAPYDTNLFNAPEELLDGLFDPSVKAAIIAGRRLKGAVAPSLTQFLPEDYRLDNIYVHNSMRLNVTVAAEFGETTWLEKRTIFLKPALNPPFNILVNN